MRAKQLSYVLIGGCCLGIMVLFAVGYSANKLLGQQADKLSKLRAQTAAASNQETSLVEDKKEITKYSELNKIAESIVPQDKDQAEAVSQIVKIASVSGISDLSSITFPMSTLGLTGPTAPKPGLTQLIPVIGFSKVYSLQITITQDAQHSVPYSDFLNFLQGLEQNRRTAEVTSLTVQPDSTHPNNVSFSLVVNEYIKP